LSRLSQARFWQATHSLSVANVAAEAATEAVAAVAAAMGVRRSEAAVAVKAGRSAAAMAAGDRFHDQCRVDPSDRLAVARRAANRSARLSEAVLAVVRSKAVSRCARVSAHKVVVHSMPGGQWIAHPISARAELSHAKVRN
jgi:hypothetical protein